MGHHRYGVGEGMVVEDDGRELGLLRSELEVQSQIFGKKFIRKGLVGSGRFRRNKKEKILTHEWDMGFMNGTRILIIEYLFLIIINNNRG